MLLSFVFSQIITLFYFNNFPSGYKFMVFLPVMYIIGYFIFFFELIDECSNPFVLYGTIGMEWIRFILMPPICAIAGSQSGMAYINPTVNSLNLSIIFMIIEFFSVSFFCRLLIKPVKNKVEKKEYIISGRKSIYYLFFIFTLIMYILFGRNKGLIRFLIISLGEGERIGDVTDTKLLIIRQLILCSIFIAFLLVVHYSWKKYNISKKRRFFYLALLAAIINVSIIVGERRSAQIYALLCSLWILIQLFPLFRKKIITVLVIVSGTVLFFMSVYKFFGAFMFNSYSDAIVNSQFDVPFVARTLQSYFFGPENIAISLDFFNINNYNIFQMFFDFLRSIFGLNYVFKNMGEVTSIAFNSFVYGFHKETGHVLSAISYGYGFLGPIFSSFFAIVNVYISIKLENLLYRLRSLELIYVTIYVLTRFVTNLFVNTPPLISQGTIMAFTSLIVIGIATIFNRKNTSIERSKSAEYGKKTVDNIIRNQRI